MDFSEIDIQYVDTHCSKAYPIAMLLHIIILAIIYPIQ